jgi:hypothetical protein
MLVVCAVGQWIPVAEKLAGRWVMSRIRFLICRKKVFVGPKPVRPGLFPTPRYGEPSIIPKPPVEEKFEAALMVGRQFGFPTIYIESAKTTLYREARF